MRSNRRRAGGDRTVATCTLALALVVGGCLSTRASARSATLIKVDATEFKFQPARLTVSAGDVTFELANIGTVDHEFEILLSQKIVDEVEGLTPGLTKQLTVTLAPGLYTYVCRLNGHDLLGMTGTLTVTAS